MPLPLYDTFVQVPMVAMEVGVINHSSNDRVTLVRTDPSHRYLATMVSAHLAIHVMVW